MRNKENRKPKASKLKASRRIPEQSAPKDTRVVFSFVHLNENVGDLTYGDQMPEYYMNILARLKHISGINISCLTGNYSKTLHNHMIDWRGTAYKSGFGLGVQYEHYPPFQFSSGHKDGRVIGYISDFTFYVVWLDKDHAVYPFK